MTIDTHETELNPRRNISIGIADRVVTVAEARAAAIKFIDQHFRNVGERYPTTSCPARPSDDDVTLMAYIEQQIDRDARPPSQWEGIVDEAVAFLKLVQSGYYVAACEAIDTVISTYQAAKAQGPTRDDVRETAQAFMEKVKQLTPSIDGAFAFMANHGIPFHGDNWEDELKRLEAALANEPQDHLFETRSGHIWCTLCGSTVESREHACPNANEPQAPNEPEHEIATPNSIEQTALWLEEMDGEYSDYGETTRYGFAAKLIRRLAEPSQAPNDLVDAARKWKPFSSAPKDGRAFVARNDCLTTICFWHRHAKIWCMNTPDYDEYPTDWMPDEWLCYTSEMTDGITLSRLRSALPGGE